jgi:hypothetical protein
MLTCLPQFARLVVVRLPLSTCSDVYNSINHAAILASSWASLWELKQVCSGQMLHEIMMSSMQHRKPGISGHDMMPVLGGLVVAAPGGRELPLQLLVSGKQYCLASHILG